MPPFDQQKIDQAVADFNGHSLTPVEAMLASHRLFQEALKRFHAASAGFRNEIGEEATRDFATQELNDVIYDIQDCVATAVRTYNSLLRDRAPGSGGVAE